MPFYLAGRLRACCAGVRALATARGPRRARVRRAPVERRSSSSTPSGRTPWLESAHPEDAGLRLVPGARARSI